MPRIIISCRTENLRGNKVGNDKWKLLSQTGRPLSGRNYENIRNVRRRDEHLKYEKEFVLEILEFTNNGRGGWLLK